MALETQILIGAGQNQAHQMDALDGFVGSSETGVVVEIETKRYGAMTPAGEAVCKAIYIQVEHRSGCAFFATPMVDERLLPDLRRFFSRPPNPRKERWSFLLPMGVKQAGGEYATGVRGSTFGVRLEAEVPAVPFNWETLQLGIIPLLQNRGRKVTEE